MTKISHSNFFAHRMLTDQGAYIHCYEPETFEDVGDAESGPQLTGGPAFDRYSGESHEIILDERGLIVHCEEIDWSMVRFFLEHMCGDEQFIFPEDERKPYFRKRASGEDFQVRMRDEDGDWYACWGGIGWTDQRDEDAGFFYFNRAVQIAWEFNNRNRDDSRGSIAKIKAVAPGIHFI